MIYRDLHNWVVDRLNGDAYFTNGTKPVTVLAQDHPDTPHLVQSNLNNLGLAVVVSPPELVRTGGIQDKEFMATLAIVFIESPNLNRSARGTGKNSWNLAVKASSLCEEQQPTGGFWAPLMFTSLKQTECDNEIVIWVVELQTRLLIDISVLVLADEFGNALVDDQGNLIEVSPTDP